MVVGIGTKLLPFNIIRFSTHITILYGVERSTFIENITRHKIAQPTILILKFGNHDIIFIPKLI